MAGVTVTGGTAAQRTVVEQGHVLASSAARSAKTAAKSGGATFTQWFNTTPSLQIVANFQAVVDLLADWTFNYDLDANTLGCVFYDDIYVLYPTPDSSTPTTLTATFASWFWDLYALDASRAMKQLAFSVVHEVLPLFAGSAIDEFSGTQSPEAAQSLAAFNPTAAALSSRNYLYFMAPSIPQPPTAARGTPPIVQPTPLAT